MPKATSGSRAHNRTLWPARASTTDKAVPKLPEPIIVIFFTLMIFFLFFIEPSNSRLKGSDLVFVTAKQAANISAVFYDDSQTYDSSKDKNASIDRPSKSIAKQNQHQRIDKIGRASCRERQAKQ